VFEFKKAAYDNLAKRYQDEAMKAIFALASLLDPRFKDFGFVKDAVAREEKRKCAEKEVIKVSTHDNHISNIYMIYTTV